MIRMAERSHSCNRIGFYSSTLSNGDSPLDLRKHRYKSSLKSSPYPVMLTKKIKSGSSPLYSGPYAGADSPTQMLSPAEWSLLSSKIWLKSFVYSNSDAVLTFSTIVTAYAQFCSEMELLSLTLWAFLELVCSELTVIDGKSRANELPKLRQKVSSEITISEFLELSKVDVSAYNDATRDKLDAIKLVHDLLFRKLPMKQEDKGDRSDSEDSGFDSATLEDSDNSETSEIDLEQRGQQLSEDLNQEAPSQPEDSDEKPKPKEKLEGTLERGQSSVSEEAFKIIRVDTSPGSVTKSTNFSLPNDAFGKSLGAGKPLPTKRDEVPSTMDIPKWSTTQENIIKNFAKCLDLEKFKDSDCYESARHLSKLMIEMLKSGQLQLFLSTFVHSATCRHQHDRMCSMFQRIINHVSSPHQFCAVRDTYGHILRIHLDTCRSDQCQFPKCDKLRKLRLITTRKPYGQLVPGSE